MVYSLPNARSSIKVKFDGNGRFRAALFAALFIRMLLFLLLFLGFHLFTLYTYAYTPFT